MPKAIRLRPDPEWIRARRELLGQLKAEVRARLGAEPADLHRFRLRYERELARKWRLSDKRELIDEIQKADIVYGGDFHSLRQAQRTHLKILRELAPERRVVLALECFAISSQKHLERFLEGKLSAADLRKKSRWDTAWGFPWENYRPLLELAKARGFGLLALGDAEPGSEPASLRAREKLAAMRIEEARRRQPGALVYVVFGDFHLASAHLPSEVRARLERFGPKNAQGSREVVVHLNSERIYFELAEQGLELTTDVVRFRGRAKAASVEFCVLGSPPWVQWQSHLLYLERADELGPFAGDHDDFDPTEQVAKLARLAARDLGVDKSAKAWLSDLHVYSPDDESVWQAIEKKLKSRERAVGRSLLLAGRTFYMPGVETGYLSETSINQAATLAGYVLHARLAKRTVSLWGMPKDFPGLIWTEAAAYFISKLVNHKRQAETLTDLRATLAMSSPSDHGREAMRLALDQAMSELVLLKGGRRRPPRAKARRKASYFEAARILGGMLGEKLYLAHRSRRLSKREILQLLEKDVAAPGFRRDYEEILRALSRGLGSRAEQLAGEAKSRRERL